MTPEQFKAAMAKAGPAIMRRVHDRLLSYCRRFALSVPPRLVIQNLHGRSGGAGLGGSFTAESVLNTPQEVAISLFSRHPGARLQEKGGTVTAKGRMLAIPLDAALTQDAGVSRGSPRQWSDAETFVRRRSDGSAVVMLRKGKDDARAVPLFLLRQQVTIPPRLGLFAAWDADAPARDQAVAAGVREGLADAQ